jgi:16S rRNA C967 or C1407 C5-methylase (RsmB/RsmF family)/NOL1/NOP2/fmu family ribosome biogenesis protein
LRLSLPKALLHSLQNVKGFDENAFVKTHESGERITSIRYNPAKLSTNNYQGSTVTWCPNAYYLAERPSFTFDPLFHAGSYYVQEASSMFLWEVLKQTIGVNTDGARVLDLCAAPGGKSTLLASYFPDGLIVANEVIKSRANILAENITKWGSANVVVTNNDPNDFTKLENYFDVIVIDAPCSGSGLFRKDNEAINEWSEENVNHCSLRQQRILADVIPCLKKDGILIYSTCSYSKKEDEDILDFLINNYQFSSINCHPNKDRNIIETISSNGAFGYRFYPDKIKGEGFFIAAFKKNNGDEFQPQHLSSLTTPSKQEMIAANEWIKKDAALFLFKQNEKILAIPERWKNDIAFLQKNLYLRKAGVTIGSLKQKDMVPDHELALSLLINDDIKKIELTKENAIRYLQKKEFNFESEVKGWALATYLNNKLGWMKILHNRVNNYYPTELRILKD